MFFFFLKKVMPFLENNFSMNIAIILQFNSLTKTAFWSSTQIPNASERGSFN